MQERLNRVAYPGKGFTVLEVLLVLILISLMTFLLMQGLGIMLHIRQTIRDTPLASTPVRLQQAFLRSTLSAMTADDIRGKHRFIGTARKISGLTLAPLLAPQGVPMPVELAIEEQENSCRLRYTEFGSAPIILGDWPHSHCRFSYLATPLEQEQSEWSNSGDELIQLPAGIFFQVEDQSGKPIFFLFEAINGRRLARTYLSEYFQADSI